MARKRRRFSAEFKAKVALEAVRGQKTLAELADEHEVHSNQITQWKKQLLDSLPEVFGRRREQDAAQQEELTRRLYQQIGQLKVELDWLKKKSGIHD
jgi:transposase-like protein